MNLNAPIFNVLPVTSVYVTTDKTPYEFMQANAAGTMGLFHMTSGAWKTVATLAGANNDVFIGVIALDKNGNKVLRKCAGDHFNKNNIIRKSYTDYAAPVSCVVALDLTSGASLYYVNGIKISFRNSALEHEMGYNLFTKFYPIVKSASDTASTTYTQKDLYDKVLDAINLDTLNMVTPYLNYEFKSTDTPTVVTTGGAAIGDIHNGASPTPAVLVDVSALNTGTCTLNSTSTKCYDSVGDLVYTFDGTNKIVTFTKKYASIAMATLTLSSFKSRKMLLTISDSAENIYGQVNMKYAFPRQTIVNVSIDQPGNEVTVESNADADYTANTYYLNGAGVGKFAYEKGSGYDLKQTEYESMTWEGNVPPFGHFYLTENGYNYLIDESKNYHVCTLNYFLEGHGGTISSYTDTAMTLLVVDTVTDSSGFGGSNTVANVIQDVLGV